MVKRVCCNSCGITLDVPQRNGEPYRDIHCPNCNHQQRVTFGDSLPDEQAKTVYGGMQGITRQDNTDDDALTQFPQAMPVHPGALLFGTKKYPLRLGRNLVGRASKTSNADVQIPTNDNQMSREHAIINIKRIADGSLRTLIRNFKDNLVTIVKDMQLETNDEVVLTNGTNLIMGHTSIVYTEE